MIARSFLALPLLLPALVGCGNAAIDDKIAGLPSDNVTPSAFHRAGQPCVLCHGVYKDASPEMVIGGSVFVGDPEPGKKPIPVGGATIIITDALNNLNGAKAPATHELKTNCAGNFYLTHDDVLTNSKFDTVAFPLTVSVLCPGSSTPVEMKGRIGRDGSCSGCHFGQKSASSPGVIACGSGAAPTPQSCTDLFK